MRTRLAYEELLTRLMNSGELTPDMEEDFRRLKDELDEREGMLARYGETYDGENREYEWVAREATREDNEDGSKDKEENLEDMRNDLERGRDDGGEEINEVTYNDLFKEGE